jgi:hypothetical protein
MVRLMQPHLLESRIAIISSDTFETGTGSCDSYAADLHIQIVMQHRRQQPGLCTKSDKAAAKQHHVPAFVVMQLTKLINV